MFDPEYAITVYFNDADALTAAEIDQLSEWIKASDENAARFVQASLIHRAIYDYLVGADANKNVMLDMAEAAVGGNGSADSAVMLDMSQLAECEKTAPTVEFLKEEIAEEAGPVVVRPAREKKPVSKFQIFTLIASAAAVILFALFIGFVPEPLPSVEVATLTDQMNVEWGDPAVDLETGCRLLTNDFPLNLKKGFVSIAYDQGVEVVVEGPALFEIERSGIFLEYGRLYSQVSETGLGFTVNTSTSQFVDMGTEFGVKADIDGSSELQVTKGKVQLFAGAKGESRVAQMVTENQAVRYNARRDLVREIPIRSDAFIRKISSAFNQIWTGPSPYEQAVMKTEPMYYWRFDWDRDGFLRNETDSSLNDEYKLFGSLGYSAGPALDSGKNFALRLTGSHKDYAILRDCTEAADDADGFSIVMWVRPEKVDSASTSAIIMRFRQSRNLKGGGRSIGFDSRNRFWFNPLPAYKDDIVMREQAERYRMPIRSNPVEINTWHHVAVTYSKNDHGSLYVDGKLHNSQRIIESFNIPTKNIQWCIGVGLDNDERRTSFAGSIDEISHYDRALSAQEVGTLYEAVGEK